MVQRALEVAGISFVRIDGKVPLQNRKRLLYQFDNDPSVRAILITVSCGAVG
jgi:SNF2 family DNA or RNA helicase